MGRLGAAAAALLEFGGVDDGGLCSNSRLLSGLFGAVNDRLVVGTGTSRKSPDFAYHWSRRGHRYNFERLKWVNFGYCFSYSLAATSPVYFVDRTKNRK